MANEKRKAVAKSASSLFQGTRRSAGKRVKREDDEEHADADEAQEQVEQNEDADHVEHDEEDEEAAEEEEDADEESTIAQKESELTKARRKELKAMAAGDIKQLAEDKGLEIGNKADMIEAIAEHEARERADVRAHARKLREVVTAKKDELDSLPLPELRDKCNEAGIKGNITKQARIELLLKLWQEDDGVDKALKKIASDAREHELEAMSKAQLRNLCEQVGVNAFVKEVIVERLIRCENEAGRFSKPSIGEEIKDEEQSTELVPKKTKTTDMVANLLASEANRKKELAQKKEAEEAAANRRKELKTMSVDELKKSLSDRGRDSVGKKDELVEQLFTAMAEDEAIASRKDKLKALGPDELKRMLASRGWSGVSGKPDVLASALLEHEAKLLEEVRRYSLRVQEVLEKKREELETKTNAELKDLCIDKDLKQGNTREDRIQRLLEHIGASGEVVEIITEMTRDARRQELLRKDQADLLDLCKEVGVEPLIKEVLVERVLEYEDAFGQIKLDHEPPAKRARHSKK